MDNISHLALIEISYISHTGFFFYLIQPFVLHEPFQHLFTLTLFNFFCGQQVGAV